jgi:hypothetical protein
MEARRDAACLPEGVGGEPSKTRDGVSRLEIAVPAERNSGLEMMVKGVLGR